LASKSQCGPTTRFCKPIGEYTEVESGKLRDGSQFKPRWNNAS
jgi:hypothetical protein